jgi:CRISPR type III-A-associated RAMP protein Csm4
MQQALVVRLRPRGPWRYGPGEGGLDRVDALYRSDRIYSAITAATRDLGFLEEWIHATANGSSPVVFSSLFPFQGESLFAIPPATAWPPAPALVNTPSPVFLSKIRWKAARFVPVTLIDSLLTGQTILADQWLPDPESGCLLRRDRPSSSPFRVTTRHNAAVDRLSRKSSEAHSAACVEFETGSGLWTVARFADESAESAWSTRIQAAFRLLADSGFGGRRTHGWGHSQAPEFQQGLWPAVLFPKVARVMARNGHGNGAQSGSQFWLLSLYSPAPDDRNDWNTGSYELTLRVGLGTKAVRMIAEGSVIAAESEPVGKAVNVAQDGFAHPVYRSGLALALQLPSIEISSAELSAVEPALIEAESACPPETTTATEPRPLEADSSAKTEPRQSGGVPPSAETEPSQPASGFPAQESDDDF